MPLRLVKLSRCTGSVVHRERAGAGSQPLRAAGQRGECQKSRSRRAGRGAEGQLEDGGCGGRYRRHSGVLRENGQYADWKRGHRDRKSADGGALQAAEQGISGSVAGGGAGLRILASAGRGFRSKAAFLSSWTVEIVGAIGVSGDSSDHDSICAQAGASHA